MHSPIMAFCDIWTPDKTFNNWNMCYDSADMWPIRAEISIHKHWKNAFILIFVWLAVICFRQNYFRKSLHFGDCWAKYHFPLYNQLKSENNHRKLFHPYTKTLLKSETCIYITNNLCKRRLGTRENRQKWGRVSLQHMQYVIANGK